MMRFIFLFTVLFSSKVFAGDIMYYVCMGEDSEYKIVALQQSIKNEGQVISSTFVLDVASATDEYMTRYNQKGNIIFKSEPLDEEDSVVIGRFEKDGKEIGITIFSYWRTGYRIELSVDDRIVKMPCKYKP